MESPKTRPLRSVLVPLVSAVCIAIVFTVYTSPLPARHFTPPRLVDEVGNATQPPLLTIPNASLSAWERSFASPELLATAPLGPALAPLALAIAAAQSPPNCSRASFLVFEYGTQLGLGAQLRHLVSAYSLAVRSSRVFILSEAHPFHWGGACTDARHRDRFECHFRPLSTCSYADVTALIKSGTLPHTVLDVDTRDAAGVVQIPPADATHPDIVTLPWPALSTSAFRGVVHSMWAPPNASGTALSSTILHPHTLPPSVHSQHLTPEHNARRTWLAAATWYFARLSPPRAASVRRALEASLGTGAPDHGRLVGAPVRASDKCARPGARGEMACVSLADTIAAAHRLAAGEPGITHVIVTSEDAAAVAPARVRAAQAAGGFRDPLGVVRNVGEVAPGTGGPSGRVKGASVEQLMCASLVTLHLQAQAGFHVLTPRSTFHSLIGVLAKTVPGKARHTMYALGADGDLVNSLASQFMS